MSATRTCLMMNKILALSPYAINKYKDWLKLYNKLGASQGIFLADFPRKWINKFNLEHSTIAIDDWDDWDEKRINEYLAHLKSTNGFISLNSPYQESLPWEPNYLNLPKDKQSECIAIGSRENTFNVPDFDKFDITLLNVSDTVSMKFTASELTSLLKTYFTNTEKIVFVDRHNYLLNPTGGFTEFTKLIRQIMEITKTKPLGEIVIFSLYNPREYPYMSTTEELNKTLEKCFMGFRTPVYGIKYLCCSEAGTGDDLHARYILTKNVAFQLTDSIPGNKSSQSITRLRDIAETERLLKKWVDEEHKLVINTEATYINYTI